MARDFQISGETLVLVKGRSDSAIGALSQLGLSDAPIQVNFPFYHEDITVNAWGKVPPETQWMNTDAIITMSLIHYDQAILEVCIQESQAGATAFGTMRRAGARMGNDAVRFAPGGVNGNHYIGLNLTSPVAGLPYRFLYAYLTQSPVVIPLGVEKSICQLTWRALPYTTDPYQGGMGAEGSLLFDRTLDT